MFVLIFMFIFVFVFFYFWDLETLCGWYFVNQPENGWPRPHCPQVVDLKSVFLLNLLSEIIVPRLFIWNRSLKFIEALHVNSTGGLPSTVIICFESYRVEEGHVGATNHGVAHPGKEGHDCNLKWRQGQEQYKEGGYLETPELCCLYCGTVLWFCGTVLLYCITVVL